MFSNFIYLIVALLIYTTHPLSEDTNFPPAETFILFFSLIIIFASFTWVQFHRLEKQIPKLFRFQAGVCGQDRFSRLDHNFNAMLTRQFVIAIVIFAINIYGLSLPSFFTDISFFSVIPTCQAFVFLGLFGFYLTVVWACAYGSYHKLYATDVPRRSYILSNISFSVPVLLPWLLLSGIADIIHALPYDTPKHLLSTTEGEIIYFLVFLFVIAMIGPVMIQKFWRCKPLEAGYERTRIENLCRKAGMEYANILYWPIFGGRMITAGVMGLIKRFRYILVTDSLLTFLRPEEIEAVIAHEIGHIKKKHLLFYLFFFVGYMLLSYATFDTVIYFIISSEPVFNLINSAGLKQTTAISAMLTLFVILIFVIYFRYIFGYFMRNFERQADAYVYTLFENAKPLISTFEKIALTSGQSPDKPNWHHFSITERVEYLKKCEKDKTWITRHDQKIRKSIAAYIFGVFLIGCLGYHLNFSETGRKLNNHFLEKTIRRAIEKEPDNPEFHSVLGDICYQAKNYEGTIAAYKQSLNLKPANPQVMNNLAWLYATCEDEKLRDPEKAIVLAQKAVASENAPHILDTLAESYYVNGQFEKAVSPGKKALGLSKTNHSYYEKQLKKFTEAAEKEQ